MPRRRKDCPICGQRNLVLSNHLADIHQLSGEERKYYLSGASNPEKRKDMSSRKRMRSDDISTVARDDESDEGISSPKRMRNKSDDETSTVSNEDIFSSSGDGESFEEDDDSDEGERSEDMNDSNEENDSDEEADRWGVLIQEAAAELRTKHNELVQSFENDGISEIDAKKQAFSAILPELRKELRNVISVLRELGSSK